MKPYHAALSLAFAASLAGIAFAGQYEDHGHQSSYQHLQNGKNPLKASITQAEAGEIALRAQPGKITASELEKERGGSGLRYSFDIRAHGTTYEVGVDAVTGRVIEHSKEGPHPD